VRILWAQPVKTSQIQQATEEKNQRLIQIVSSLFGTLALEFGKLRRITCRRAISWIYNLVRAGSCVLGEAVGQVHTRRCLWIPAAAWRNAYLLQKRAVHKNTRRDQFASLVTGLSNNEGKQEHLLRIRIAGRAVLLVVHYLATLKVQVCLYFKISILITVICQGLSHANDVTVCCHWGNLPPTTAVHTFGSAACLCNSNIACICRMFARGVGGGGGQLHQTTACRGLLLLQIRVPVIYGVEKQLTAVYSRAIRGAISSFAKYNLCACQKNE